MKIVTGRSNESDVRCAIKEAVKDIADTPDILIFTADEEYFREYSILLYQNFPESIVIGNTSYIHMCDQGYDKTGICLLAISGIQCCGGVIEEAGRFPGRYMDKFQENLSMISENQRAVCFEVCALSYYCEELFLDRLHGALEERNIPLFGGSAGSVVSKDNAMISYNGEVYTEAIVYVFLYGKFELRFYKENIFKPTSYEFVVTDAEVSDRIVYEYDNVPAARMLARTLKTDIVSLNSILTEYPMGRVIGEEIFITDHNCVVQDEGLKYYANVYNNTRMVVLKPDDYRTVFQDTMKKIESEVGKPDFSIVINCVSRSIRFEKEDYIPEFHKGLQNSLGKFICFSGYGEQLNHHHLNQTMIIATFSKL